MAVNVITQMYELKELFDKSEDKEKSVWANFLLSIIPKKYLVNQEEKKVESKFVNEPNSVYGYTTKEVSIIFDVKERTIYNWKNKDLVKYKKVGGKIYYCPDSINNLMLYK